MIIDAHYHLEPRLEPLDRVVAEMDRHGIDRTALIATMVDVFHADSTVVRGLLSVARRALMGRWRKLGLLVYRTSVTGGGKLSILGSSYRIYPQPDNESVALAMAEYPEKLNGWIFVNPSVADPIAEVETRLAQPGFIGVKSHPFWHRYPVRLLDDTAALCSERRVPLLIHLGGDPDRGDFRFLPDRHPELKVLYAHAGVPFYRELWSYAKGRERVFIDLSSPYLDEPLRRTAVQALGPSRCLYGSDGPYGYPDASGQYDRSAILRDIDRLPVTTAERERILSGNFVELIDRS